MTLISPPEQVLMSAVAERCVCRHLTVAHLVIAALGDVEGNRSAPRDDPLALAVAERVHLRVTAATPFILLSSVQVHMNWVYTSIGWQTWRSVPSLLVGPALR